MTEPVDRKGAGAPGLNPNTVFNLSRATVMVVDDEPFSLRLTAQTLLGFGVVTRHQCASADEATALRLPDGAEVHCYDGLSLADGQPIAVFRSVFPAARFPRLPALLAEFRSVTAALAAEGLADFTRASTRITARAATPTQALHLRIPDGAPVLRTRSTNIDPDGQPVEYGQTWFAGDRVTLTVAES
jgi:GntR family phosphonate transport system transcriptional regulator